MFQFLAIILKIPLASVLVVAGLSAFDVTAAELLTQAGLTPERMTELLRRAIAWALPNMILRSIVIVPLWCVGYLLRPPRG